MEHDDDCNCGPPPRLESGHSRRSFLAKGAAGAAAAWAAPALLSRPAGAGSGSCATSRLDWTTILNGAACLNLTSAGGANLPNQGGGGIDGVFVRRQTFNGGGTSANGDSFRARNGSVAPQAGCSISAPNALSFPRGIPTGPGNPPPATNNGPFFDQTDDDFFSLYMEAAPRSTAVEFSFWTNAANSAPTAVDQLCFALGDLDTNNAIGSRYRDVVTITGTDAGGAAVAFTSANPNPNLAAARPVVNPHTGDNPYTGVVTQTADDAGTLVLTVLIPVRTLRITFTNTTPPASPTGPQWVGISDLLWCTP